MLRKIYLFFIFLTIILFSLTAMSMIQDYYNIINMSGEELLITVRYSGRGWPDVSGLFTFGVSELIKHPLPHKDIKHPYIDTLTLFSCYPEEEWGIGPDGDYRWIYNKTRSAREIISIVINELILFDMEGNIVLTLDDINESDFEYIDPRPLYRLSPCIIITSEMVKSGRIKYLKHE